MSLLLVIAVLAAGHILGLQAQQVDLGAGTGLPDPRLVGLEQKPLVEQLLARKEYMGEYLNSDAFKSRKEMLLQRFAQPGNGRGVLIVAGGRDMFANAAITVLMLRRHLHSSIPVEVVHFGAKEKPQEVMAILQQLNSTTYGTSSSAASTWTPGPVYVTDAYEAAPPDQLGWHHKEIKEIKSFPAKVYAVAFVTRFQQVMLLDADSMPLVDPALLFGLPSFRSSGNLFWPDLWHSAWVNASIYKVMAGDHMDQPPWEGKPHHRLVDSGQLLLDRLRHADVMQYLWLLNSHHEWVYKHMHGDKDTFLLAFAMAGKRKEFKMVPCFTRDAMVDVPGHQHRYHHLGMAQSVPPGVFAATVAKASRAGNAAATMLLHLSNNDTITVQSGEGKEARLFTASSAANAQKRLGQEPFLRVGVPVVFHRTSFNSKFFPDCLDKKKLESKYCEVQYLSVPLSNEQAGYSLKPHMYAFNEDQVSAEFYAKQCSNTTAAGTISISQRHMLVDMSEQTTAQVASPVAVTAAHDGRSGHTEPGVISYSPNNKLGAGHAGSWYTATGPHRQQQQHRLPRKVGFLHRISQWLMSGWSSSLTAAGPQLSQTPATATAAGPVVEGTSRRQLAADSIASLKGVQLQQLVLQHMGLPPEWHCSSLRVGDKERPIPIMKIELFSHMHGVLQHSYQVFKEVRELLKV